MRLPSFRSADHYDIDYFCADARALVRLQADHVSRTLVPAFYRYLQAQDADAQIAGGREFHAALEQLAVLLERADVEAKGVPRLGLYSASSDEVGELGWTDVMAGPCESSLSKGLEGRGREGDADGARQGFSAQPTS